MKRQIIKNGRILTPYRDLGIGSVLIEDGKIKEVTTENLQIEGAEIIDAGGNYVAPGFVDIHSHGAGGADFMDGTVEAYMIAAEKHAQHGTTYLLPTTVASTTENLLETLEVFRQVKQLKHKGATMEMLHLEGPYFAYNMRGAQNPLYLRNPEPAEYNLILEHGGDLIRRWSMAPELPGSLPFAQELTRRGILCSMAHTDATFEEAMDAYEAGFRHITHFFSCCSTVTRRNAYRFAGVIEAGYLNDGITLEIIADGIHVPASLLKLVYKIKGADRMHLVTDSMRAAGMSDGPSIIGSMKEGIEAIVEDGVAKLPDRSAFAGSVCTTDRCVRTLYQQAGIPLLDVVRMMTDTPARVIGVSDRKGSISPGKDADLVIFDSQINIQKVIIGGQTVFTR